MTIDQIFERTPKIVDKTTKLNTEENSYLNSKESNCSMEEISFGKGCEESKADLKKHTKALKPSYSQLRA